MSIKSVLKRVNKKAKDEKQLSEERNARRRELRKSKKEEAIYLANVNKDLMLQAMSQVNDGVFQYQ